MTHNIKEKGNRAPAYLAKISHETFDKLKEQILQAVVVEKRYRDRMFTAKQLATLLHTNTRYISIVLSVRYHANFYGGLLKSPNVLSRFLPDCKENTERISRNSRLINNATDN